MRIKLIGGIRQGNLKDPLMGLELRAVVYPMSVTNYDATEPSDPEEITIADEDELIAWADSAFEDMGYEIFTLDVEAAEEDLDPLQPAMNTADAAGPADAVNAAKIIGIISAKKREYEDSAPSTPEAEGERDAVVAALATLEIHAKDAHQRSAP